MGAAAARQTRETDFSIVPHAVANRSQRREGGGFTISARAIALYAQIRKFCGRQRRKRGGTSCEVGLALLAAATGVQVRQARNLRAQLVAQGMIRVELEHGFHGVNVYHLVLPVPAAVEQLLPGRPARTPGPHYVVTPAIKGTPNPRQNFAAAVDVGVDFDLGVEVSLEPTPETESGAAASGAALSAAERPAAPNGRPSEPGATARPGAARAARDDGKAKAGLGEGSARRVPADVVTVKPSDTGRVVELWSNDDEKRREVIGRFLRQEFPGIPDDVVGKTLTALRAAKLDELSGGRKVRSAWRYAAKVAARILAQSGRPGVAVSRPPAEGSVTAPVVAFLSSKPEQRGPALSQGESTQSVTTEASEKCEHGHDVGRECRVCDHRWTTMFERARRRQLLGIVLPSRC